MSSLTLERDGAQLFANLIIGETLETLKDVLVSQPRKPGVRICGDRALLEWLSGSATMDLARSLLGARARPVRAILFDKNRTTNWTLGWHQDRTIAVRERRNTAGFANWTVKAGMSHVEPPFDLLERMITVRLHLDDVDENNGPLLIAPGSHRSGRIEEGEIGAVVKKTGRVACLAHAGDAWAYRTAILHASEASRRSTGRRVLQIDFSTDELPGGLEWAGIG